MSVTASASAKTILFGEHAVVYGEPAIAIPLSNTRTYAGLTANGQEFRVSSRNVFEECSFRDLPDGSGLKELLIRLQDEFHLTGLPKDTLSIRSDIPIASGLGSGAALSVAVIRAFAKRFEIDITAETVNRIVFEIEKIYHGTPSGIDNTVIAFEQPICFIKNKGFRPLQADLSGLALLVADSGIRSRTVDVVSDVRAHFDRNEDSIHEIGNLVRNAEVAIQKADPAEIGRLMNENQRLLRDIDVSCPELDELISLALGNSAYGAKLTGAGRGGNFIVLAQSPDHAKALKKLYEEKGIRSII